MEEVAVELVARVLGENLGVKNTLGIIEFVLGNEGREKREKWRER